MSDTLENDLKEDLSIHSNGTFITKLIDDSLFVNAMATAFEDTKSIVLPDIVKDVKITSRQGSPFCHILRQHLSSKSRNGIKAHIE